MSKCAHALLRSGHRILAHSCGAEAGDILALCPSKDAEACPSPSRIPFEDLRNGSRPYLFGGAQRPACRNCHIDTLWANFCQYKNSGPVCYDWDIDGLSREFVARCARHQRPPLAAMLRWVKGAAFSTFMRVAALLWVAVFCRLQRASPVLPELATHAFQGSFQGSSPYKFEVYLLSNASKGRRRTHLRAVRRRATWGRGSCWS